MVSPPILARGRSRAEAGSAPGGVIVRGSWTPLAMMMAIFATMYAASVLLAVLPHARQGMLFAASVCALFGVSSGCFLGRLARNLSAASTPTPSAASCSTPASAS